MTSCAHVTMTTPTFASRESLVVHSAATGGHAMVVPTAVNTSGGAGCLARASAVEAQAAAGTTAASATTATALPLPCESPVGPGGGSAAFVLQPPPARAPIAKSITSAIAEIRAVVRARRSRPPYYAAVSAT